MKIQSLMNRVFMLSLVILLIAPSEFILGAVIGNESDWACCGFVPDIAVTYYEPCESPPPWRWFNHVSDWYKLEDGRKVRFWYFGDQLDRWGMFEIEGYSDPATPFCSTMSWVAEGTPCGEPQYQCDSFQGRCCVFDGYTITFYIKGIATENCTNGIDDDGDGLIDSDDPDCENQPPVVVASASPSQPTVGENISFSSAGSYDPDGTIVSYYWDFGDGTTSSEANPVHSYESPGNYTVVLTVEDDKGAKNSTSILVEVKPSKPDLKVSKEDVRILVSDAVIGSIIRVRATIHNIGGADAGSFKVRFEYSPNIPLLSTPDEVTVPMLAAGSSTIVEGDFRAIFDTYTVRVIVDPAEDM